MTFTLDPRLAAETRPVADWPVSSVLLRDDVRFPWLILVPRRAGAVELFDLTPGERTALWEETNRAQLLLRPLAASMLPGSGPVKMNTGALGNVVSQLHIHVVARRDGDEAWPGPVWGAGERQPFETGSLECFLAALKSRACAV